MTRHGSPHKLPAIPALRDTPDLVLYPADHTMSAQIIPETRWWSHLRRCKSMRPRVQNHDAAALVGSPRYQPNPKSP